MSVVTIGFKPKGETHVQGKGRRAHRSVSHRYDILWASNVALGKSVSTSGTGFYSGPTSIVCSGAPQAASSVTDGAFHAETDCWLNGVAWLGTDSMLDINLNGTFTLSSAIVQADDNVYAPVSRD
jgi:hypothetical protein